MEKQETINPASEGFAALPPSEADRMEEKCLEFAQTLGLDHPVPVKVLEAALRDETYAHHLLASRRSPPLLKYLLANPPKADPPAKGQDGQFSNAQLVRKAATALLRWGQVGFSVVDQATLERRRAACLSCPNLTAPPDRLIYRLARMDESEMICGLCGCSVRKKMRLPTESCPDQSAEQPGLSRWGEPWQAASENGIAAE